MGEAADTIRLEKKKERRNSIRTQWTKYNRRSVVAANMRQKGKTHTNQYKLAQKTQIICICQKKAVPLHAFLFMKIDIELIRNILYKGGYLEWDKASLEGIAECYTFLEQFASNKIIYGINTGFGPMAQWRVADDHLRDLQYNIIRSHATGAGEALDDFSVRASMLARVGSFAQCKSGVHPELVALLTEFINRGIYPFIPKHGSVGASGDLVQLAHIALCLIGEGKVHYQGEWRKTREVMNECGLNDESLIEKGLMQMGELKYHYHYDQQSWFCLPVGGH